MNITFSPVRADEHLHLSVSGMTPAISGKIELTLRPPHGSNAPEAARFLAPITIENGEVDLPPYDRARDESGALVAVPHNPQITPSVGTVDLSQIRTAAQRHAEDRAEWREIKSRSRSAFASACKTAQIITQAVALAWIKTGELPAIAVAVIDEIADQDMSEVMEIAFAGSDRIGRANPFLDMMRERLGLTHEQLDELFGWQGSVSTGV